jgi:uncharacterized damage-inducible protein DinB
VPDDPAPLTRTRPTYLSDERELLDGWLEFHRSTLLEKCDGLSDEMRKARPVASSLLSLHGLVRHLTETERNWFGRIVGNEPDLARIWLSSAGENRPLYPLDDASWEEDLALYLEQCEHSRQVVASRTFDDYGTWRDKKITMRSAYLHMIQEYARHNGHADMIRELLDGTVGI